MKMVHICGLSAVGKNYLIKRFVGVKDKADPSRSKHEQYLLNRFEIGNRFDIVGPESPKRGITIEDVKEKVDKCVEENQCDTLIHHWQSSSMCLFDYAKNNLPEYEQKTFIIWLDPLKHLTNAVIYRPGDTYKHWSVYHLKTKFLKLTRDVLFTLKSVHGETEESTSKAIDIDIIPEQLNRFNAEVVTLAASRNYQTDLQLYTTVDPESLRMILNDAVYVPKKK